MHHKIGSGAPYGPLLRPAQYNKSRYHRLSAASVNQVSIAILHVDSIALAGVRVLHAAFSKDKTQTIDAVKWRNSRAEVPNLWYVYP
ncbi:hypothetical protein AVEN_247102-1 [Araneus ventricosus]|uniref:Uncharacterized protein n=1 Tax=Araneus ventricosus TaxID=182803 RepID=A0A4Y2HQM9_ARAVE|nr:hypothetical protein AVEN_247102-1 [Araneus ventricosus]